MVIYILAVLVLLGCIGYLLLSSGKEKATFQKEIERKTTTTPEATVTPEAPTTPEAATTPETTVTPELTVTPSPCHIRIQSGTCKAAFGTVSQCICGSGHCDRGH